MDFASFDTNGDKMLQSTELAVLVVIPQNSTFGTMRSPQGRELPMSQPLVVDGVTIPAITEAYVGAPVNLGVLCHELSHLLLDAPDMYFTSPWPYVAGDFSIMDRSYSTTHLDPFEKLKLRWLKPRVVDAAGDYSLGDIESTQDCMILHEETRRGQEHFILENRWRAKSYDAGVEQAGAGLRQDGLAIWHVIEDPAVFDTLDLPGVAPGDWGRRSIRLIRATGPDAVPDDGNALFTKPGTMINGTSSPARLVYADKKPAPFAVELLSEPGPIIRVRITR